MGRPKVFISYRRTNQTHQERVRSWADRLLGDGIDVVVDVYDLREGHDKYAFMERMVTDSSVSHVLVVSDQAYKERADGRVAGVGTESQIISREIYERVDQEKFIPIVCAFDDEGMPYLPTFLQSRIWINFSTSELVNRNWEQLVRLLYGKPQYRKPEPGIAPSFITNEPSVPANSVGGKWESLKQSVLEERAGIIRQNRRDFLEACLGFAENLRIREVPAVDRTGEDVLEDAQTLRIVRDPIVDWVLLESETTPRVEFCEILVEFLEQLRERKARPSEMSVWQDAWSEAISVVLYEIFLYLIAALLRTKNYESLREIYMAPYLRPSTERYGHDQFDRFDSFCAYSELLQSVLAPEGKRLLSPSAELVHRNANRQDLPFPAIVEADLVTMFVSLTVPGARWPSQTIHYSPFEERYPFFIKATQHMHFRKLAILTGIEDVGTLRERVREGLDRAELDRDYVPGIHARGGYWSIFNMDGLDTVSVGAK